MLTVFWPEDVDYPGLCYGWVKPAICIVAVVPPSQSLPTLSSDSESGPQLLGSCSFAHTGSPPIPALQFLDNDYNLVYFYRHTPTSMRFYSLDAPPIERDPDSKVGTEAESAYGASILHDSTRTVTECLGLNSTVINQFNSAKVIDTMRHVRHVQKERNWFLPLVPGFRRFTAAVLYVSHTISDICNAPLFGFSSSLKDASAIIQQIDVRAEQSDFLIREIHTLHRRDTMDIAPYSAKYVNFYNTIWLILNDITIGTAFGSVLCENHVVLARMLNYGIESILVTWIQWALGWLNSWPAGLKLNTELSRFYSHTFIDLVSIWGRVLQAAAPYLPAMIYTIGTLSSGGMTLAITISSDLLSLLTAHIYMCYIISTAVYHRQLRMAGSLWNLFRGKRYNVLRNRTDAWEYDVDQLLFGTILFTLLAFLFPTVLAYYALFAIMRLCTILLRAAMETMLTFMNHFPLFALTLRVKDPWRLPGGVYFVAVSSPDSQHPLLIIENQPVSFSAIFSQYIRLWSRLSTHYSPLRLLRRILSGDYLVAIPRYSMRYSTAPRRNDTVHS